MSFLSKLNPVNVVKTVYQHDPITKSLVSQTKQLPTVLPKVAKYGAIAGIASTGYGAVALAAYQLKRERDKANKAEGRAKQAKRQALAAIPPLQGRIDSLKSSIAFRVAIAPATTGLNPISDVLTGNPGNTPTPPIGGVGSSLFPSNPVGSVGQVAAQPLRGDLNDEATTSTAPASATSSAGSVTLAALAAFAFLR
jgi:hypothetical protein